MRVGTVVSYRAIATQARRLRYDHAFVRHSARAALAATAFAVFALGCGGGGGGGPASPPPSGGTGGTGGSTSADIKVQNNSFSPPSTTVPVGTTVTWTWNACTGDGYGGQACTDHSIVFDDGGRSSAPLQSEGTFSSTVRHRRHLHVSLLGPRHHVLGDARDDHRAVAASPPRNTLERSGRDVATGALGRSGTWDSPLTRGLH